MSDTDGSGPEGGRPSRSLGAAAAVAADVVAIVTALKSGRVDGVSGLLAAVFLATWATLVLRFLLHLYERYPTVGLALPSLYELGTLLLWGVLAFAAAGAENPQIPRLIACGALGALLFFLSASHMEGVRSDLVETRGLPIRRGSDVVRESIVWLALCGLFRRIDLRATRKIRRWLAAPDSAAGFISRAAGIVLLIAATVLAIGVTLALGSELFGYGITPEKEHHGTAPESEGSGSKGFGGGGGGESPQGESGGGEDETEGSDEGSAQGIDCSGAPSPGSGAPEPARSTLTLGWEDTPQATPGRMEALSTKVLGCPGRARPIPGEHGAWWEPGTCGEELRSIIIAPAGLTHPVALIEQAGEFAEPLIKHGEFINAIDRFPVGVDGDAYVINTRQGSYVLIREHDSGGPLEGDEESEGACGAFSDKDVAYVIVGPGLIESWRSVAAASFGGIYPIDAAEQSGDEEVFFRSPSGIEATAHCTTPMLSCTVEMEDGEEIASPGGATISQAEVEELVGQ